MVMRQHNVWCEGQAHTKRYAAASPQLTFTIFKKLLNSVTLTRNLRAS